MNRNNMERYLSRFKIKEPGPDLKYRVLLRAKNAWAESRKPAVAHVTGFRLLRNYTYVLAGVILLSAITLKITQKATVSPPNNEPMVAQYVEKDSVTKVPQSAKKEPGPKVVKQIENDSEMKDLYASLGIDYRKRQLFLSLHRKSEFRDSVGALLEQQKRILEELESQPVGG